jgi:RND family efflux transporter MFP subunit
MNLTTPLTKTPPDLETDFSSSSPLPILPQLHGNGAGGNGSAIVLGQRKRRSRWSLVRKLALGVVALGLIGFGVQRWLFAPAQNGADITATVTRTDLPVIVTERGDLESAETIITKCEIEGQEGCKIVFLAPEGSKVKKGEVVLKFDADKLRQAVAAQDVKFNTADGKAKAAKEELDVQRNKAEGDLKKAELAYKLAVLDKEKYLEGEYKIDVKDKESAIKLAERDLKEAEEKLEGYRTLVKKGFGTPETLSQKELDVAQKQYKLAGDRDRLMVLQKFMKHRQEEELTFKATDAERELARTFSSARANIAKAEADLVSALVVAQLEKEQLERARKQFERAEITAPTDGIMVYCQMRYWDPSSRIQVGGVVGYQFPLFQIPELDKMQVKVRIHESKVKKVQIGQKAEIRIEAQPGLVLRGTVTKVATLADSEAPWMRGGIKEFECIVKIDELPTDVSLKPGFTAEVSIKVNQLADVLAVPIQAVAQREGKHVAYVAAGAGVERREISVGENNDKFVEVKEGLSEGEAVCLDARARMNAENQAGGGVPKSPEPKTKNLTQAAAPKAGG